jgi:putative hemolysin
MPNRNSVDAEAAREISYAYSAKSRAGRFFIRGVENLTGRPKLIKMAKGYDEEVARGRDFWEVMAERYRLRLMADPAELAHIPPEGPAVVVANHPFGILDGLMFGRILSMTRPDFKIMAHKVFHKAKDLAEVILPIDFDETREAMQTNLRTRQEALAHLEAGGLIGVFPGGTVSTASKVTNRRAMDPAWKTFTAKMIQRSREAAVVPLCFEGQNSRLFQLASHAHYTLRMALLINEFDRRVGGDVHVRIGAPIPRAEIDRFKGDPKGLMDHLRVVTYQLSRTPMSDYAYGLDLG